MAFLEITDETGSTRRVEVGGTVLVGRGEDCEIQVVEKKASRKHLRIGREPGQPWVAEDLDSSNGTYVGETRVLRLLLADGLVLRVGDTRLTWREEAAAAAPALVGGTLALKSVGAPGAPSSPPVPAAPAEADEPPGPPAPPDAQEPETVVVETPLRPFNLHSFGWGLGLLIVALLVFGGVQHFLAAKAERAREESKAKKSLQELLSRPNDTPAALKAFQQEAQEWMVRHPAHPDRPLLERHLAAVEGRGTVRAGVEDRFDEILARLGSLPEAQVRSTLLAFKRELPEDEGLAERVRLAFQELDRRRAAYERAEGERVREEARGLVAQNLPGEALRHLSAWRSSRGLLSADEEGRLRSAETETVAAVKALAETTLAAAKAEQDPEKRRLLLQAAWPGLAGTHAQDAIADALRYSSAPSAATPGGPGTGPGTGPDVGEALLAKAAEAERCLAARRWGEARVAFQALGQETAPTLLKQEWAARRGDVDAILTLVAALAEAAQGERPPVKKVAAGSVTVLGADEKQVTARRGEVQAQHAWTDLEPDDVLAFLAPAKPSREQRLALAVLAASLGKPEALVEALAPLYEPGPAGPEVDALVARLLEGKARAPEGGYRLLHGALLDRAGYERRQEEERLAALEVRAVEALNKLSKEPVFRRVEKMREARAELDRRRLQALLAIFDEKHYPYPYQRGVPPYTTVQLEVDRRVDLVRQLWEGDDHVKITRTGPAGKLADEAAAAIQELEKRGRDVKKMKDVLARYEPYMTGETLTLKEFFLNSAERKFMAYNRWVMEVYNPSQTAFISEVERKQVGITNEYRMMLGFTVSVEPGAAAYESIDESNVARILDAGRIVPGSVMHLRALRIDDRLVRSARGHSLDMQARGFFDHFAPPNPATGKPRTSPFDRMREAGYEGQGASENIAQSGGWKEAHLAWCHSSGHHRNILSGWTDMGSGGAGGALWTQNFGTGGGRPPVIENAAPTTPGPKK